MKVSDLDQAAAWLGEYAKWENRWDTFLRERTHARAGIERPAGIPESRTWWYTHQRLRKARGLFRPIVPRLVVLGLFGMCSFVAYWVRLAKIDVDEIAGAFLLMLESGWLDDGKPAKGAWPRAGSVGEALAGPQAQVARLTELANELAEGLAKAQARLETGLAARPRRKKVKRR